MSSSPLGSQFVARGSRLFRLSSQLSLSALHPTVDFVVARREELLHSARVTYAKSPGWCSAAPPRRCHVQTPLHPVLQVSAQESPAKASRPHGVHDRHPRHARDAMDRSETAGRFGPQGQNDGRHAEPFLERAGVASGSPPIRRAAPHLDRRRTGC